MPDLGFGSKVVPQDFNVLPQLSDAEEDAVKLFIKYVHCVAPRRVGERGEHKCTRAGFVRQDLTIIQSRS